MAVFDRGAGGALTQKPGAGGLHLATPTVATCADGRGLAHDHERRAEPRRHERVRRVEPVAVGLRDHLRRSRARSPTSTAPRTAALMQPAGAAGCVSDRRRERQPAARPPSLHPPRCRWRSVRTGSTRTSPSQAGWRSSIAARPGRRPRPRRRRRRTSRRRHCAGSRSRRRDCPARPRGVSVVARGRGKVSFRLSEPSIVKFRVQRIVAGRRTGDRCAAPSRSNRRGRRCDRYHSVAGRLRARRSGRGERAADQRAPAGRRLARGRYRLRAARETGEQLLVDEVAAVDDRLSAVGSSKTACSTWNVPWAEGA